MMHKSSYLKYIAPKMALAFTLLKGIASLSVASEWDFYFRQSSLRRDIFNSENSERKCILSLSDLDEITKTFCHSSNIDLSKKCFFLCLPFRTLLLFIYVKYFALRSSKKFFKLES